MTTTTGTDDVIRELLGQFWLSGGPHVRLAAGELAALDPSVDRGGAATRALIEALRQAWERGWQPADVVHVVGRDSSCRHRLAVAVIAADAYATRSSSRAPADWLDQLLSLGCRAGDAAKSVNDWHVREGRSPSQAWEDVLLLAGGLRLLPPLTPIAPPPSRWTTAASEVPLPSPSLPEAARVLRRIRALLAKAESTEFPQEAEALTAKAQELMSAHAVDEALLDDAGSEPVRDGVRSRRVHVAEPYVEPKMMLLSQVGDANGVRTAWYRTLGIATLVGMPVDLEAVELLFTSLLVQAVRAMTVADARPGDHERSPAFRRSFLLAYGSRIGERLAAVRRRTTADEAAARGLDLLPVLRGRQEAVDAVYEELFPKVRGRSSRAFDTSGWYAGRRAADQADLTRRRGRLPR